jgi:hypothetical protein
MSRDSSTGGMAVMISAEALLVFDAYEDGRKTGAAPQPVRASKEGQRS